MDRLFVPLNTGPFEDFQHNGKTYELRGYGRQYTEKHVYAGRKVELRKGYSGQSLWGMIGNVESGGLEQVLRKVGFKKIVPNAKSKAEAVKEICEILGRKDKYLAFEVIL